MSWRCWRLRPQLVDFAAGSLSTTEQRRLQPHLDACPHCTGVVAALGSIPTRLQAQPPTLPSDAFFRRQHDAIMRTVRAQAAVQPERRNAWRWLVGPALAATTAVGLMIAVWQTPRVAPTPSLETLDAETLLSAADVARTFVPDGQITGDTSWNLVHDLSEIDDQDLAVLGDLVGGGT